MLTRDNFIKSSLSIQKELLTLFKNDQPLIIFDIGACEAEDSIRYEKLFPNSSIYAFEPRPDNLTTARDLIKLYNCTHIILENIALSNENSEADFFISEGEPDKLKNDENWNYGNKSSSLLQPSDELKKHTSWLKFNNKIKVQTVRLDKYAELKNLNIIDIMHLDVQGAELMVLEGAGAFLNKIKLIWLEVESVELYKGQPLKKDVEAFMSKNDFINVLDTVNNVSGDQLYMNRLYFQDEMINKMKSSGKNNSFLSKIISLFK